MLGALLAMADALPARAQGYGWFGGLFGGGQPQEGPQHPGYGGGPNAPRRRLPRRKPPVEQAQEAPAKPKISKNVTVFVDVFGDSFGQLLANGLDDALADKAEVGVIHMARGSSGLVNGAYYDWPKAIDDLLARKGEKPSKSDPQDKGRPSADKPSAVTSSPDKPDQTKIDVAVVMIGSNDRQPIIQDGKKIDPGTDEWNAIYRKRAMAIAEAFQKKRIPLIWVGVPIVKNDDFADDMAALNDIYRDVAARTGATYVDTWEAFSDDNGDFAAYGPDINGQTVRLRSADGIYFTKAGARKLAHFVEGQVRRDLDGKTPLPELPTAAAPPADSKNSKPGKPAVALAKPEAGPIRNLGEPPAAKDGRLGEVNPGREDAPVVNTLVKGEPDPAPVGRADNFRWSGDSPPAQ